MIRISGAIGALFCFVAIAMGAFGAHLLKEVLPSERVDILKTGATYLLLHGIALFSASGNSFRTDQRFAQFGTSFFVIGSFLFSGSLFALALTDIRALGAVTPFGGASLIAGWITFAVGLWPRRPLEPRL